MPRPLSPVVPLMFHGCASMSLGLMAGFFWTYSANVNLATLQLDGSTYAIVQSGLNRNVRHGMFFSMFFAPPVLCGIALILAVRARNARWWLALATAGVLYALGIVVFTAGVNLPLNAYTESWDPRALPLDWTHTRDSWNAANLWRTLLSALAFALSLFALSLRALPTEPVSGKGSMSNAGARRNKPR